MTALGLTLFAIGFVILAATAVYGFVERERTGAMFRRRNLVVMLIIISGVLGFGGMFVLYLSQQS
ncbi:hypothetical protein [Pseudarthrobacter sp. IC2-21]|uniref:hypothetical protein n=1 Tax=Pseudarthrobacter sp. IC2-21 TaxID=3092262 RepID=UPI002A6AB58D|nr:hypothetical protein [Pseudarthrobacter sp. IC2-21]